jgi:hypothetical protein
VDRPYRAISSREVRRLARMNASELKARVLLPMAARVPGIDTGRIRQAYEDVSSFARVHQELADRCEGKELSALAEAGKADEARQYVLDGQARAAQLKALYASADTFCSVLLNEAQLRPPRLMTVVRFAERSPRARQMDPEILRGVYRVSAYQNRVIMHREAPRMMSFACSGAGGLRLFPVVSSSGLTAEEADRHLPLLGLRRPLTHDTVTELFDTLPVLEAGGTFSPARAAIDGLVALVGCRSVTAVELVAAIDGFAAALAELAPLP